jgi:L-aminopeptidase/D-esterase-like protein
MAEDRNRSVAFDFPELQVGVAEYDDGPTGCTVLHLPDGADCALDIRGGAPGVFGGNFGFAHAICFAGGSLYGLEAATGVAAELLRQRGSVNWTTIDLVSGAIIWDWTGRDNLVYPDKELGRRALLAAATGSCPVGARGAGRSATVGKFGRELTPPLKSESSGQGGAFTEIGETGAKLFMLTVVNAVGVVVNRNGTVVRGALDPATGRHVDPRRAATRLVGTADRPAREGLPTQNTTISALVTNVKLSPLELDRLGKQVHTSMARAIRPFHAINDGDVFFTLSTGTVEPTAISNFALTEIACDLAWDAVLNAVNA